MVTKKDRKKNNGQRKIEMLVAKIVAAYHYCVSGVWNDPRRSLRVRIIKILNLAVQSFFDRDLQIRSMALTYSTVLSVVPAFALLVAIGRGFGLQDAIQNELYNFFPSQHRVISTALTFVDSYLNEATQGLFVGVGIVVLLWTVISLLSSIEDAFNTIWSVKRQRTLWQKFTDYIAICLIIPILLICSSGVSIFMSTTIQDHLFLPFLTPVVNFLLELAPFVLMWLAFSISYCFIPNLKINFKYAAIAGALCAIGFQALQMLFLNGQLYVAKYNAIYGSFAFLPLMLIWMQFSWLLVLTGCVLTYSLQNVLTFNFLGDGESLSAVARHNLSLIIMAVVTDRFVQQKKPLSSSEIAMQYNLPVRAVGHIIEKLKNTRFIYEIRRDNGTIGYTPAVEVQTLTVGTLFRTLDTEGRSEFMPGLREVYGEMLDTLQPLADSAYRDFETLLVKDVPIPTPDKIRRYLESQGESDKTDPKG